MKKLTVEQQKIVTEFKDIKLTKEMKKICTNLNIKYLLKV